MQGTGDIAEGKKILAFMELAFYGEETNKK